MYLYCRPVWNIRQHVSNHLPLRVPHHIIEAGWNVEVGRLRRVELHSIEDEEAENAEL